MKLDWKLGVAIELVRIKYHYRRNLERQLYGYNYAKYTDFWNSLHHSLALWIIVHLPTLFSRVINAIYLQLMLK